MNKKLIITTILFFNIIIIKAQSWSRLGTGTNALKAIEFYSICSDASGNIYASGEFEDASGWNNNVAKWNGNTWNILGTGADGLKANGRITTTFTDALGNVYAAGDFKNADDFYYVAKWNGSSWSELGTGTNALNANGSINSICSDASGNIYVAGNFSNGKASYNGNIYVAKWNGSTWSELGAGGNTLIMSSGISSICSDPSGNIYVVGDFVNSDYKHYVAKWDGSTWSELGTGKNALNANDNILAVYSDASGNIYAGGVFRDADENTYLAKWDGSKWSEFVKAGFWIEAICSDASGNIYIAGDYYLMKWNGNMWFDLATGAKALNPNNNILTICSDPSGNIYAGGFFTDVNNNAYVAKFGSITNTVLPSINIPIKLYPNPTKSDLTIDSPEVGQVVIYNSLGEVMASQNIDEGKTYLNLDKLEVGVYSVCLKGQNNFYAPVKIVKN